MGIMWEALVNVSKEVNGYWEGEDGFFRLKNETSKKANYSKKISELIRKAVFGEQWEKHKNKELFEGKNIDISPSIYYKLRNAARGIGKENLKKALNPILLRLSTEVDLADDQRKKDVINVLYRIFKRKEVKDIVKCFLSCDLNLENAAEERGRRYSLLLLAEKILGNPKQIQDDICYKDYFIDAEIEQDDIEEMNGLSCYYVKKKYKLNVDFFYKTPFCFSGFGYHVFQIV